MGRGNVGAATTVPVPVGVNPSSGCGGRLQRRWQPPPCRGQLQRRQRHGWRGRGWTKGAPRRPASFSTSPSQSTVAIHAWDAIYTSSQSTSITLLGLLASPPERLPIDAIIHGTTLSALLSATTTYDGAPAPSTCAYSATPNGGSAYAVDSWTVLDVGRLRWASHARERYPTATVSSRPLTVYAHRVCADDRPQSPAGRHGDSGLGRAYAPTLQIAISATANPGYNFAGWLANAAIAIPATPIPP